VDDCITEENEVHLRDLGLRVVVSEGIVEVRLEFVELGDLLVDFFA
jgi:hypothetical protein